MVMGHPHGIPKGGSVLPFIKQTRRFTFQQEGRIRESSSMVFLSLISILQFNDTGGFLLGSSRFPASFGGVLCWHTSNLETNHLLLFSSIP